MSDVVSDVVTEELNRKFAIPGMVKFDSARGGLARAVITTPAAEAHIYLQGAHIAHFQPRGEEPVLFTSKESSFERGKAIRGGVPIIFPWFGKRVGGDPASPMHGLVRSRPWNVQSVSRRGDDVEIAMEIRSDDFTRATWPHEFSLRLVTTIARALDVAMEVTNPSAELVSYEEGLHTYIAVTDVRRTQVRGLLGTEYKDKMNNFQRVRDAADPLVLSEQTDRVYIDTKATCAIDDIAGRRRITIAKEDSDSTVVWNPWSEQVKKMADLGDDEWPSFICVESANVGENAVKLAPGSTHALRMRISSAPA